MQPAYENFTTAEFLTDDAFVSHQLAPTPESAAFWTGWLQTHPHCQQEWHQAAALLDAIRLGLDTYAQTHLPEETIRQLLARIQETNAQAGQAPFFVRFPNWTRWAAAAAVLLAAGIGFWWTSRVASPYEQHLATLTSSFSETTNSTDHPLTIHLPDRSTVWLSPDSRLSYPADFNQKNRRVYLSGEATFEVTRNEKSPFLVHANELVTKVLGTKFLVRAFAREGEVRIKVHTGQVSVYEARATAPPTNQKGVLLLPNQQVVFTRQTQRFDKMLVEAPRPIKPLPGTARLPSFSYNETPVTQVFQDLENAYGISIRYNKDDFSPCQLTSSLARESFTGKLTIICKTFGATYDIIDGQVLINGGGCQ
ncbi:FecR family protein [Spirosoma sp. KUDC1026]|uniref:FecR family protein n=1 Tax=Spirosoma sp. KUDC1026 TaxID=2745947 RepID=UPI00159BA41A|nr:FecR family protein [Spirosoma sp. KUDC1026]QKZ12994.1 FecR family protein [Spirosoma sp. KUDC1026]